MGTIVVEMTGDEAKLYRAILKATEGMKGLEEGTKKAGEASKQAAREQEALGRAAAQVLQQIQTPQERYNQKMQELNVLLQKGKLSQEEYGRAVQQAQQKLESAGKAGSEAFGPKALAMVTTLAGAFGVGTGLAGAIGLVNKELEVMAERRERAKQATITTAHAQIAAFRNLGAVTVQERTAFEKEISKISGETGVSERDLYLRASETLSARGPLPISAAMQAIRLSAQIAPESTATGQAIAGGVLDIMKITGATAPQALGYLQSVGQMARVTNAEDIARNLAPAATAAVGAGATPKAAGALWAAITGGMADPTGRKSGTAVAQLSRQLEEFLPEAARYKWENRPVEELVKRAAGRGWEWKPQLDEFGLPMKERVRTIEREATGLKTTEARIAYLQAHPEIREQFLQALNIEEKARRPAVEIVTGAGPSAEAYAQFLQRMPTMQEAGGIFAQQLAVQQAAPMQRTAALARGMDAAIEQLETANQPAALQAIIRGDAAKILQDAGMGSLASQILGLRRRVDPEYGEELIRQIEDKREELLHPVRRPGWLEQLGRVGTPGTQPVPLESRAATETERAQAAALGDIARLIRDLLDETKKHGQAQGRNPTLAAPNQDR